MKKFMIFALMAIAFVSCNSNGSCELQIDEMNYSGNRFSVEKFNQEEYSKVMSVLDIVPGSYELSWTLVDDLPQMQFYNIALKIKLRLKRHVSIKQELMDKVINGQDKHPLLSPFIFVLLDENGNYTDYGAVQDFDLTYNSYDKWRTDDGDFNKDQTLEFLRFLQSAPGAEIELTLNAIGGKQSGKDCIKLCKSVKGLICTLHSNDKQFESIYGKIE